MIATTGTKKPCCTDASNLATVETKAIQTSHGPGTAIVQRCSVCSCRHFTVRVAPAKG